MKMPRRIATGIVAASLAMSLAVAPAQAQSLSHTALATSTGLGSSAVNTVIRCGHQRSRRSCRVQLPGPEPHHRSHHPLALSRESYQKDLSLNRKKSLFSVQG